MQGALEQEQKLKTKLQVRKNENSEVLAKLQTTGQKINNMEKHNKDLDNIRVKKDSFQLILKQKNANYQKLKAEKDSLSVKHNKLQKYYKNMEQTLLKQLELKELKVDIGNVYQTKNEVQMQFDQRHVEMDKKLQRQMAFNEKFINFQRGPKGSSLSIMTVSSVKIMNSTSNIPCFR